MKDHEGFLFKLCCVLLICVFGLGVAVVTQSCSSTATVEITRGFEYAENC